MAIVSKWFLSTDYTDSVDSNDVAAAGSGNSFSGGYLVLNGSGYASKTAGISGITGGDADRAMGIRFKATTASAVEALMFVGNNSTDQGLLIIKLSATSIRVDLYGDPKSYTVPSMSNATEYAVWIEYTAADNSARLWLDGTESSSGSQVFAAASNLVANKIYLGADADTSNLFTGSLRKGVFYNGIDAAARTAFFAQSSASASASASTSPSASQSPSSSASKSLSPSASASKSASRSLSPSSSASKSQSPSASQSPSGSQSPSASLSPSASESASLSPSLSPSASLSQSPSVSPSPSPAVYVDKYSALGNTYTDKYSDLGNTYIDKYTDWGL